MSYNQWPSASTLMEWLRDIENKKPVNLLNLTLWNSTPELREKSINFARSIIEIQDKIINIIKHTRKTLLFHEGTAWVKKEGNSLLHATMENYDGAEVCELVRVYLLSKLPSLVDIKNAGLYTEDGIAVIH